MKEEIPLHPREPRNDVEQRRTTERGNDPGTSEPGTPPRTGEGLEGAPTEDSPARGPTERVERIEDATSEEEVEDERP